MINVNMTDKAGVTLATAGKYCADNVKVTPSADILRKDEQTKTATPTTSAQDITPDAGKALSKVTVNPITAAIVGNLDASSFAASIVAAIEGKGVTVPDGTLLDGMAALIESIQAGGGKVSFANGTVTFESDTTFDGTYPSENIEITHNSGFLPIAFYMYTQSSSSRYTFRFLSMILNATNVNNNPSSGGFYLTLERYNTSSSQSVSKTSARGYVLETIWNDTFIRPFYRNMDIKIQAGVAVDWFIVGVEGATV